MPPQSDHLAPSGDPTDAAAATSPTSKPQPRPEKSAAEASRIRRLNRRRAYLDRNPTYFDSVEHELADPLLYDTFIRRFQTPSEREAEGRRKGYGRVLESSLLRGEAKLSRMAEAYVGDEPFPSSSSLSQPQESLRVPPPPPPQSRNGGGGEQNGAGGDADADADADAHVDDEVANRPGRPGRGGGGGERGETNFSVESDIVQPPQDREEARQQWLDFLRDRFVSGRDEEFDYSVVDENEEYDDHERRDAEDAWFENEEPRWADDGGDDGIDDGNGEGDGTTRMRGVRTGETGVQDF